MIIYGTTKLAVFYKSSTLLGQILYQWQTVRKQHFFVDADANRVSHEAVCWEKPCLGWLKCNVDAVIFNAQGKFSVGCVIRNFVGEFVAEK